jgi:hypothetical protein
MKLRLIDPGNKFMGAAVFECDGGNDHVNIMAGEDIKSMLQSLCGEVIDTEFTGY